MEEFFCKRSNNFQPSKLNRQFLYKRRNVYVRKDAEMHQSLNEFIRIIHLRIKRRSGCRDAAGTEVKRIRAYGGCLGTKSRRRTR